MINMIKERIKIGQCDQIILKGRGYYITFSTWAAILHMNGLHILLSKNAVHRSGWKICICARVSDRKVEMFIKFSHHLWQSWTSKWTGKSSLRGSLCHRNCEPTILCQRNCEPTAPRFLIFWMGSVWVVKMGSVVVVSAALGGVRRTPA